MEFKTASEVLTSEVKFKTLLSYFKTTMTFYARYINTTLQFALQPIKICLDDVTACVCCGKCT